MKIFAQCMECQKKLGHPSFEPCFVDTYDGIANIQCAAGHKSLLILQSQKFEILMESGANAMLDGYTLEAATTFASAYERVIEFFINVLCVKQCVDPDKIKNTFKYISKSSERQFGAFLLLYLAEFKETYPNLARNEKIKQKRNEYIHQGIIPTPIEAKEFCEQIYEEIFFITKLLCENFQEIVLKITMSTVKERSNNNQNNTPISTTTGTMFFSISQATSMWKEKFQDALDSYRNAQEMIKGSISYMEELNKAIS
jgi:hypothetical protein